VISKKDIAKLFSVVENPKHVLMLKLCYGMGLRVSEIVGLISKQYLFFAKSYVVKMILLKENKSKLRIPIFLLLSKNFKMLQIVSFLCHV
jgi:site-specific recombinase XerD